MVLFLDFDGVLRRAGSPLYQLDRDCVEAFERAIRELPGVEIVITSSWREGFTLEEMRKHFSGDIAPRIVGVTPMAQDRSRDQYRYREVLAYLRRRAKPTAWVAIDDDPLHYPEGCNVVLVDPREGFGEQTAASLRVLAGGSSDPSREPVETSLD